MTEKKNIILSFGNKELNNSLYELSNYFDFNLELSEEIKEIRAFEDYKGFIIHEDILKDISTKKILDNDSFNKIIVFQNKKIKGYEKIEKLQLPVKVDQINKVINDNIVKNKFRANSSLKIKEYILDKNSRKLIKAELSLELTEKEIELIELLNEKLYTKKKEILSRIWKYSNDADTHTVETHIYRLRKKINKVFNDEKFIRSEKEGYTI